MTSAIQKLVSSTGEPAYAVDRDGTVVAWNAAASRAFGYAAAEAVGSACWSLLQGQDAFGNAYCGPACPLRRMATERRSVNRCRMTFRASGGERNACMVTTLVLANGGPLTLIHLCRPEPAADAVESVGAGPSDPREAAVHGILTRREREVLQRLAEGRDTREIATLLGIGERTVRSHVEHILRKLHAHSRLEAVAIGRRLGIH